MFPKPQLHMQVFESKTQETNNYGEGDCPSIKTEQQQKVTNSIPCTTESSAVCYTEQWNILHCCSLFTGERWAGIFTGTATPAPQLPQVLPSCRRNIAKWMRRCGFLPQYCHTESASSKPQTMLHTTWKKSPYNGWEPPWLWFVLFLSWVLTQ